MAYIPPHKRHIAGGSDARGPTPTLPPSPPSLSRLSISSPAQSPNNRGRKPLHGPAGTSRRARPTDTGIKIIYADSAISRWWWVSAGGRVGPEDLRLECLPCEPVERRYGAKPLVLVADVSAGDGEVPVDGGGDDQPASIARRILNDLIASAASARSTAAAANEVVKLSVAARVGKVFFHGSSSSCLESIRRSNTAEVNAGIQIPKRFYTDVPSQFLEYIEQIVVPKAGFDFELGKEYYHVKVFDKCRPDLTITCKCVVVKGSLQIHKIELNPVRHLVADVSCLHKDFDLRIILITKNNLNSLDDAEKDGINGLINAAIIDTDLKGGLRWPLGKDAIDERFSIAAVWHTRCRTFRRLRMRLKLRNSDRYSHKTSVGEVSDEITIKLTGIAKHLRGVNVESSLLEMLQEDIELIWNDFLSFKPSSS